MNIGRKPGAAARALPCGDRHWLPLLSLLVDIPWQANPHLMLHAVHPAQRLLVGQSVQRPRQACHAGSIRLTRGAEWARAGRISSQIAMAAQPAVSLPHCPPHPTRIRSPNMGHSERCPPAHKDRAIGGFVTTAHAKPAATGQLMKQACAAQAGEPPAAAHQSSSTAESIQPQATRRRFSLPGGWRAPTRCRPHGQHALIGTGASSLALPHYHSLQTWISC